MDEAHLDFGRVPSVFPTMGRSPYHELERKGIYGRVPPLGQYRDLALGWNIWEAGEYWPWVLGWGLGRELGRALGRALGRGLSVWLLGHFVGVLGYFLGGWGSRQSCWHWCRSRQSCWQCRR